MLQWSWKIMAKSTNILKFISILQFSQMYLIFEINVSKEIKKMIAKDCKRLQKTSMCINLVCILWVWAFLKLLAITLWLQSCCLHSSALMRSPSALGDRPGSRPRWCIKSHSQRKKHFLRNQIQVKVIDVAVTRGQYSTSINTVWDSRLLRGMRLNDILSQNKSSIRKPVGLSSLAWSNTVDQDLRDKQFLKLSDVTDIKWCSKLEWYR